MIKMVNLTLQKNDSVRVPKKADKRINRITKQIIDSRLQKISCAKL